MNGIKIVLPAATVKEAVEAKLREMVSVADNMEVRVAFMGRGNDIFVEADIVPEGTPAEPVRSTGTTATGAPRKKPGPKPGTKRKAVAAQATPSTTVEATTEAPTETVDTPAPALEPETAAETVTEMVTETVAETVAGAPAPGAQRGSLFGNLTRPDNRESAE